MKEEWKEIDGFPSYWVSSMGRVTSLKSGTAVLRKLSVHQDKAGKKVKYLRVGMVNDKGEKKNRRVHRLVLLAFKGQPPTAMHCGSHIDGNPFNNWSLNLKWATYKENEADKIGHGTKLLGQKLHNAKLNPAAVRKIRRVKVWTTAILKSFMATHGVSRSAIKDVRVGRTWSHIV